MSTVQQIWEILTNRQRRSAVGLLGMMLIAMVLEILGLGAVLPALALMTDGELATNFPAAAPVLERLGNPSGDALLLGGMLALVGLFGVKVTFLGLLAWFQARFVSGMQADLSQRLFEGYLRQPYTFHLQHNSAELLNYIGNVSGLTGVVQIGLNLVAEALVLLGIAALLLVVEPVGAVVVVSSVGLAGWGFHRLTRRWILAWGEARFAHDRMSIQHIQQGLGGVKDVKLLGREAYLVSQFQVHAVGSAHAARSQTTLQALPRLWLELLAVGGLTALIAIMVGQGKATQDMLPVVALFAAAAFRFLPSVNRVLGAVQGIRYQRPVVDALHGEIQLMSGDVDTAGALPVSFDETLALEGVSFRYPGAEAWALRDVSLTIERGTSVGFVGTSGAGKSTLVDVVLGLLNPDTGAVKIDGRDIRSNLRGWQDQIGYVPQSIFLTDDTLRRNVAFGIPDEQIDESAIEYAVASAQLDSFVKALPDGLDTVVGERGTRLSGGQLQRIGIARALYHNPGVLVMDEGLYMSSDVPMLRMGKPLDEGNVDYLRGGYGGGRREKRFAPLSVPELKSFLIESDIGCRFDDHGRSANAE